MVTRRRFVQSMIAGAAAGPLLWRSRGSIAQATPVIADPRFSVPVIDSLGVPKFVDALPRPGGAWPVVDATAAGTPVQLAVRAVNCEVLPQNSLVFPVLQTPCWSYRLPTGQYTHTYLGPTIVAAGRAARGSGENVPTTVQFDYSGLDTHEHVLRRGDPAAGSVVDQHVHGAHHHVPEVRFIAHKHGGAGVDPNSDGYAEAWIAPDGTTGPSFGVGPYPEVVAPATHQHRYPNDQGASTVWYHDHAIGITRLNVYAGLAAGYLVTDANEAAMIAAGSLPALGGDFDIPLVIQDRTFYADGRLAYPDMPALAVPGCATWPAGEPSTLPEFFGDCMVVNGKTWPYVDVDPAIYRLRLLNGCNSRFLQLSLDRGLAFTIIGTDGGLLTAPVHGRELILGPAERFDVLVDFRGVAGRSIVLTNRGAKKPFPKGTPPNPRTDGLIMQFRVRPAATLTAEVTTALPTVLNPAPAPGTLPAGSTRRVLLFEGMDEYGRVMPLLGTVVFEAGTLMATPMLFTDPITETPATGTVEEWEIYNTTADAHPIHLHEAFFSVMNRQRISFRRAQAMGLCGMPLPTFPVGLIGQPRPAPAYERGFKETVIAYPGEVTRIRADYRDAHPGRFVWHCHILEHEDHEMMRPYDVLAG